MSSWVLTALLVYISTTQASVASHNHEDSNFCYATTDQPYLYFASKTAYNAVYYKNDINIIPDECTPRQVWMLVRHGARYPLRKKIEAFHDLEKIRHHIMHNHERHNRGQLCSKDIKNLKLWKFEHIPLTESDKLAEQGYNDLHQIGERTWLKFYNSNFSRSEKMFKFQYTNHEKTKFSADAFADGFFGKRIHIPKPTNTDLLPSIYPDCKIKPLPDVIDPPDQGSKERSLFKDSPVIKEVIANITRRLGFLHPLTIEQIDNMYDMCRYKKSWNFEEISPWCSCFLESELQALEYIADLSYYYNSGHGYSGNLRTGCPLLRDLIERFRDISNGGNEEPHGVYYFGHSTTLYNLIARMEILKDTVHITHDNYYNMTNRIWRTSLIAPFSGNFAVVMLNCKEGERNRIVFYHNERPFKFPGCHGYVCSWNVFHDMYRNVTDPSTCNFDFCIDSNHTVTQDTSTIDNEAVDNSNSNRVIQLNRGFIEDKQPSRDDNETVLNGQTTTERSNAIIQKGLPSTGDQNEHEHSRYDKHLVVKKELPQTPEKLVRDPKVEETTEEKTLLTKPKWTNQSIHIFVIIASSIICMGLLTIFYRFAMKNEQTRSPGVSYQSMNSMLLKDFNI